MNDLTEFSLTIKDLKGSIYKGKAKALTSKNDVGVFDILPEHENFICMLHTFITIYQPNDEKKEMQIDHGVLHIQNNEVTIFLGTIPYAAELLAPAPAPGQVQTAPPA